LKRLSQYYKIMLESSFTELGFVMNTGDLTIRSAQKQELYLKFKIPYPTSEQECKKFNYMLIFRTTLKRQAGSVILTGRTLIVTVLRLLLT